jgi:predicted DNA-binding transcriptional regulator AlpA
MFSNQVHTSTVVDTHQCSALLGFAASTIRISRVTGTLAGFSAPAYRKIGRKVVYDRVVIDEWLAQFSNQPNTTAGRVAK